MNDFMTYCLFLGPFLFH